MICLVRLCKIWKFLILYVAGKGSSAFNFFLLLWWIVVVANLALILTLSLFLLKISVIAS